MIANTLLQVALVIGIIAACQRGVSGDDCREEDVPSCALNVSKLITVL